MLTAFLCASVLLTTPGRATLVPRPFEFAARPGVFTLNAGTVVVAEESARSEAERWAIATRARTGFALPVVDAVPASNYVQFQLLPALKWVKDEGYRLTIRGGFANIRALTPRGLRYGALSLQQLRASELTFPQLDLTDLPRFEQRGLYLDVSTTFVPSDRLKSIVDQMSEYKLNRLYLQIGGDGGFRLEVEGRGFLTGIGAWRKGDGRNWGREPVGFAPNDGEFQVTGGFYTAEEMTALVQYASERNVVIVPAVEWPGRAMSTLAAYPQLAGEPESVAAATAASVFGLPTVLNPGVPDTWQLIDDVIGQVVRIFPSRTLVIGGRAVDPAAWRTSALARNWGAQRQLAGPPEIHAAMLQQIADRVRAQGGNPVVWGSPAGESVRDAVILAGDSSGQGFDLANRDRRVVLAPAGRLQFDSAAESAEVIFSFDAWNLQIPARKALNVQGALGRIDAALMTPTQWQLDAGGRLAALAETLWARPEGKSWAEFARRYAARTGRAAGREAAPEVKPTPTNPVRQNPPVERENPPPTRVDPTPTRPIPAPPAAARVVIFDATTQTEPGPLRVSGATLRYAIDEDPTAQSPEYREGFVVPRSLSVRMAYFAADGRRGPITTVTYIRRTPPYVGPVRPGLWVSVRPGTFTSIPVFRPGDPERVMTTPNLEISRLTRDRDYAAWFRGFVFLPAGGTYTFWMTADEGAELWLDGQKVLDQAAEGPGREVTVRAELPPGLVPLEVRFMQRDGPQRLQIEVESAAIRRQAIPANWLFHNPDANPPR